MRSIGVKTAATCDTIGGRSDKESDPPPGGKRVASLLAPRPSNSEHTWESAGPSPLEKLEARGILRMPSMHGGPAGPGIRPQLRDLRPRGPRPLALPRWSRPPPGLGYWFLALGRRGRAALPRDKLLPDSARGAQRLRASSGISDLRSSPPCSGTSSPRLTVEARDRGGRRPAAHVAHRATFLCKVSLAVPSRLPSGRSTHSTQVYTKYIRYKYASKTDHGALADTGVVFADATRLPDGTASRVRPENPRPLLGDSPWRD